MKKIAIITARSGSKGLKDKNILDICGKPMLAYSIEAAKQTNQFDRIIVSTDSKKYGEISEKYGAEVMYRGEYLSNDTATTYDVLEDILNRLSILYDYFVLLQPTSPLRSSKHIVEATTLFESRIKEFDFLVSMKEAEHTGVLVKPVGDDMSLRYFDTDFADYRRQNCKEYSPNGAIFIAKPDKYLNQKHFFGKRSMAYFMDSIDSVDVDCLIDYKLANLIMKERLEGVE